MSKIDNIIEKASSYSKDFNGKKFLRAYKFAKKAHSGQFRKSGEPYIDHPIETANILTEIQAPEDLLIAALLHDVPEDTSKTIDDIKNNFGPNIAFLVDGITKFSKVYYQYNMQDRQVESLRKLLLHSAKDPRIILIKLADRLHNMRTLQFITKPEKKERIARETKEIYVPIADLLGVNVFKLEIEDLCLKHLEEPKFLEITNKIDEVKRDHDENIKDVIRILEKQFSNHGIPISFDTRQFNATWINNRMMIDGSSLNEATKCQSIQITTDNIDHCYRILGIIHSTFKPVPDSFKDFIANPQHNGYKSLKTVVFGPNEEGIKTVFYIRTNEMHLIAKYGLAAQFFNPNVKLDIFNKWTSKVSNYNESDKKLTKFWKDLKKDILEDRIYVFTNTGTMVELPKGATAIDFAYAIHTEIGDQSSFAEINGVVSPMATALKTGDTVFVSVDEKQKFPRREWLSMVTTNFAKNKIKEGLKKLTKDKLVGTGMRLLEREFLRLGLGPINNISKKEKKELFEHLNIFDLDQIAEKVGAGDIMAVDVVRFIYVKRYQRKRNLVKRLINGQSFRLFDSGKISIGIKIVGQLKFVNIQKLIFMLEQRGIKTTSIELKHNPNTKEFRLRMNLELDGFEQLNHMFEFLESQTGISSVERTLRRPS